MNAIVEQIEAKKRSQKKLPTWFNHGNIYYPNKLNIEQTSSEITAEYKSEIIEGADIIDLTGGFGVDCFYFSKHFDSVTHCEINEGLSTIADHNFNVMDVNNVQTIPTDGIQCLKNSNKRYDWIYIDPSRRHDQKGKVFFLKDCYPNVTVNLNILFKHADNILIKTSPLLDISLGMQELGYVKAIHVVAVDNEVKELLWMLQKGFDGEVEIKTVNIKPKYVESFNFNFSEELQVESRYSSPLTYLYEPNVAILKAGAFNMVSKKLNVFKLHKHSHLYTNEHLIPFPGRRLQIENVVPFQKKRFKQLGIAKANIITRNFPETVQNIRKALKIKDGGSVYLYFTINALNEKIVIICSKIS